MQSNSGAGQQFHRRSAVALAVATGLSFESEVPLALGNSPKSHRFDLATLDGKCVGEAKAYAWTASGNVPSAKISALREAVQFLEQLPKNIRRFIIMRRSVRSSTGSVREAARVWGVSKSTAARWITAGRLLHSTAPAGSD